MTARAAEEDVYAQPMAIYEVHPGGNGIRDGKMTAFTATGSWRTH